MPTERSGEVVKSHGRFGSREMGTMAGVTTFASFRLCSGFLYLLRLYRKARLSVVTLLKLPETPGDGRVKASVGGITVGIQGSLSPLVGSHLGHVSTGARHTKGVGVRALKLQVAHELCIYLSTRMT